MSHARAQERQRALFSLVAEYEQAVDGGGRGLDSAHIDEHPTREVRHQLQPPRANPHRLPLDVPRRQQYPMKSKSAGRVPYLEGDVKSQGGAALRVATRS